MASEAPTRSSGPRGERSEAPLLELAPDLAQGLDESDVHAARTTSVQTVRLDPGPFSPTELFAHVEDPLGLLVADGLIIRDILLADSTSSDLIGPGDVAALGVSATALLPAEVRWTASVPSRVAVLDAELLTQLEAWPGVTARLLARATQQTSDLAVQRAYSQLPRVDLRLLALFWHMAERWGRVTSAGIVVRMALTHEALGHMVGARRPTVSLALKELARTGTVVRRGDGAWLLRQDGLDRLRPNGGEWQAPETTLIPSSESASVPMPDLPLQDQQPALRRQLDELSRDYAERERRVREVLARCAATREQLIAARERRASTRPHPRPGPR